MTTEYEDALSEMNTILEKENEDLHAKIAKLEGRLETIEERREQYSVSHIRSSDGEVQIMVSAEVLVDFYEKAQPLIVELCHEAKIDPKRIANQWDMDIRFGEREYDYRKRKRLGHNTMPTYRHVYRYEDYEDYYTPRPLSAIGKPRA